MDNNSEHFSPKANNSILSIIKKFVLLILLTIITRRTLFPAMKVTFGRQHHN